jgi:hypothetical protein
MIVASKRAVASTAAERSEKVFRWLIDPGECVLVAALEAFQKEAMELAGAALAAERFQGVVVEDFKQVLAGAVAVGAPK